MQPRRELLLMGSAPPPTPRFTARGALDAILRQRRVVALTFALVFIPILVFVLMRPPEYASETKILVQRQRFDPVITAGAGDNGASAGLRELQEQDVDAEIDLLQGHDLLRRVVVARGMAREESRWRSLLPGFSRTEEERVEMAVRDLRKALLIEPPNKSNLVTVRYRSHDPQHAAGVLQTLAEFYLEKHLQVHRPAGSTDFFNEEVDRNRQALNEAEARLVEFTQAEGVVDANAEDASLLQQIATMDASIETSKAQILATRQRIANLDAQLKKVSPRITTEVRTSPVLLDKLKGTLHDLELKRAELLTKYKPEYRLVQDLDGQIAQTQAAIRSAEQSPSAERATNQDPVHGWLQGELAKARAELVSLQASARATEQSLREYRARAIRLAELNQKQRHLGRAVTVSEETYLAALRKQSEARMSEALDRSRIMNVAIAEAPTVPVLPTGSRMRDLSLGMMLALTLALVMAVVVDRGDPSFRSPYEVEAYLDVPVLAAISQRSALAAYAENARRRLSS